MGIQAVTGTSGYHLVSPFATYLRCVAVSVKSRKVCGNQTHIEDLDTGRAGTGTEVDVDGCTIIDNIESVDM